MSLFTNRRKGGTNPLLRLSFLLTGTALLTPSSTQSQSIPSTPSPFPNCQQPPLSSNEVCNPKLDSYSRAKALVANFTFEEKINNSIFMSSGVERLGLPPYDWWSEALHGVASSPAVIFADSGEFSYATSFPTPILLGSAFDDEMILEIANVISDEGRAFSNFNRSGIDFWTPNINPFKDPRWGRGIETPGEDPYHLQSYVAQLIKGLQGDDPKYRKVVATCKHFAAYDLENWGGNNRFGFDSVVNTQDLQDYYLPTFRTCYRDAKSASSMCSYNSINGIPACANGWLLQTLLREHWNWTDPAYYVTSDCDAVQNIWDSHHYTSTPEQSAADALIAGTDRDCGLFYQQHLPGAYAQGLFNDSVLDQALIRGYTALADLGYFDDPSEQPYRQLAWSDVNTKKAQDLAYKAAWEGIVLLKNQGVLPLKKENIKSIALIGPWANATLQMQGNYQGVAPFLHSPVYAAQKQGLDVTYVFGTNITSTDSSGFDEAISAAKAADATVYIGGIDTTVEAESMDRDNITWPGNQLDLISELSKNTNGKPLVVFQMGGGQIDDSELVSNHDVSALLWAGYPGQAGGDAMIDILLGNKAPAGRLPTTQYPADYINQVPMTDMNLLPSDSNPGRTYKWYTGTPIFPFGYGLHYTNFTKKSSSSSSKGQYKTSELISKAKSSNVPYIDLAPFDTFTASITNTGSTSSDYIALAFLSGEFGPTPYPNKTLVSYQRLHDLKSGDSQKVTFNLTLANLARADSKGDRWLYKGRYTLSLDAIDPTEIATFEITGDNEVLEHFPQPPASSNSSS